jgi:hypothetical protein
LIKNFVCEKLGIPYEVANNRNLKDWADVAEKMAVHKN